MLNEREVTYDDKKGKKVVLEYEGKDGAIVNHDPDQSRSIHCNYCGAGISFDKNQVFYGNISTRHTYVCKNCTGFKDAEELKKSKKETKVETKPKPEPKAKKK